jgi:hypothetical protein
MARYFFLKTMPIAPQRPTPGQHIPRAPGVGLAHWRINRITLTGQRLKMRQMMRQLAHHQSQSAPTSADQRTPLVVQRTLGASPDGVGGLRKPFPIGATPPSAAAGMVARRAAACTIIICSPQAPRIGPAAPSSFGDPL